jgi:membrane-associated phospholipid phosphatase
LRIPLYIAGGIVAFSRVMVGVHYFSDVIVGTFIGVATALFFTYKFLR